MNAKTLKELWFFLWHWLTSHDPLTFFRRKRIEFMKGVDEYEKSEKSCFDDYLQYHFVAIADSN